MKKKKKSDKEELYFEIWLSHFKDLQRYKSLHGDILVPEDFKENGFCLGAWLVLQRNLYRKGKLKFDREDLLNSLGMVWNVYTFEWENHYKEAVEFYNQNGHLDIPYNYISSTEKCLGTWLFKQKKLKHQKKLEDWKIERLENLGVNWRLLDSLWESHFCLAEKYYKENGNLLIPIHYISENFNLGGWIVHQRQKYKENRLSDYQIKKLEKIKMVWRVYK